MAERRAALRIGTSGYMYDDWRGVLYPARLPKRAWLGHYAEHFDTVEINNTFYHLPPPETFRSWREQVPPGFCFALKFSRFGSHLKKLTGAEQTVPLFLGRAELLGESLGPILVQLPPRWRVNRDRLAAFLGQAGRRHRWAFEFRDPSWLCEPVFELLEAHGAALCIHDKLVHPWRMTAGWTYLRFHGPPGGSYSPQQLSAWAGKIGRLLAGGTDVYAYFNNDVHGYAVRNARDLGRYALGEPCRSASRKTAGRTEAAHNGICRRMNRSIRGTAKQ